MQHRRSNLIVALMSSILLSLCAVSSSTAQLHFNVVNANPSYSNENVFFEFWGAPITGTINGQPILVSTNYTIADIGTGVVINDFMGGKVFVSLGTPMSNVPPNFANSSLPDYGVRWDKFEISFTTNSAVVSCANLTAVDFAGIPLQLSAPSGTVGWHGYGSISTVFSNLAALSGYDSRAVITNNGQIIRVINPGTLDPNAANPYTSWQPYIDYVRTNNITVKAVGDYNGILGGTGTHANQTFHFLAHINSGGDLVLTGSGSVVGAHTLIVAASNLVNGIWSGDPLYSIDGGPAQHQDNSVYDAAIRDVVAGFNLGLVGTGEIDPRTGQPFTNEETWVWYNTNNKFGQSLAVTNVFGALWGPGTNFYNEFAALLATNTEAYPFSYMDVFGKPLLDLGNDQTLVLTILPDLEAIPEPSSLAYVGGGILLLALSRFIRRHRR